MLGYALFTLFDALLKSASRGGYPQWQLMATTGMVSIVTVSILAALTGGVKRLATRRLKFHIIRGCIGLVSFTCGLYAIRNIPLVDCYGVIFAAPIIMTLLSVVWLREHVGWRRWLAVGAGFIGVTIMLRAGAAAATTSAMQWGYAAALGCAVFNAVSLVMVRRYGRGESNLTFSFYSTLCNLAVTGSMLLATGGKTYAFQDLLAVAGAGVLSGVASVFLMTAFQRSPAAAVAPFQYTQMLWGAILGYVVFHDIPSRMTLLGAGIVIGSGWFVLWREARLAHTIWRANAARADMTAE